MLLLLPDSVGVLALMMLLPRSEALSNVCEPWRYPPSKWPNITTTEEAMLPQNTQVRLRDYDGVLTLYIAVLTPRLDGRYNGVYYPGTMEPTAGGVLRGCFELIGYPREAVVVLTPFEWSLRLFGWCCAIWLAPAIVVGAVFMVFASIVSSFIGSAPSVPCLLYECSALCRVCRCSHAMVKYRELAMKHHELAMKKHERMVVAADEEAAELEMIHQKHNLHLNMDFDESEVFDWKEGFSPRSAAPDSLGLGGVPFANVRPLRSPRKTARLSIDVEQAERESYS